MRGSKMMLPKYRTDMMWLIYSDWKKTRSPIRYVNVVRAKHLINRSYYIDYLKMCDFYENFCDSE